MAKRGVASGRVRMIVVPIGTLSANASVIHDFRRVIFSLCVSGTYRWAFFILMIVNEWLVRALLMFLLYSYNFRLNSFLQSLLGV